MAVRRRVLVSGRVQGVFFRDSCSRQAISAGVTGWVGNTRDGRVVAVFEGEASSVDRLVAWCRHGPPRAVVSGIEVSDEPPQGESSFRVY